MRPSSPKRFFDSNRFPASLPPLWFRSSVWTTATMLLAPARIRKMRPDSGSIRLAAFSKHLERFLKLRAHRNVESFAIRQPGLEQFCIDRTDVTCDDEISGRALDARVQVGLVAAKCNSVRVVGEKFPYHLELA